MKLLVILTIVFAALKITGVVAWSWWAVTSPLWAGVGLSLSFLLLAVLWTIWKAFREARP